jgi:hypothetical protein
MKRRRRPRRQKRPKPRYRDGVLAEQAANMVMR